MLGHHRRISGSCYFLFSSSAPGLTNTVARVLFTVAMLCCLVLTWQLTPACTVFLAAPAGQNSKRNDDEKSDSDHGDERCTATSTSFDSSRIYPLHATPHVPCDMSDLVPMLIGC